MAASDQLMLKSTFTRVIGGSPFVILTRIKSRISKANYNKYEVVIGSTLQIVSIETYIMMHNELW